MHAPRDLGLLSLLVPLALGGCTGRAQPGAARQAIVGGVVDHADPSVVSVLRSDDASMLSFGCTGTVIAPRVILTAAHCTPEGSALVDRFLGAAIDKGGGKPAPEPVGKGGAPAQSEEVHLPTFTIFTGDGPTVKFDQPNGYGVVQAWHTNPAFDGNFLNGHDLALIVMEAPLDLPVIPLRREPLTEADLHATMRAVGYGISEAGDGEKREVSISLDEIHPTVLTHNGATGTCQGDSGGPTFLARDGVEEIVGVTSYGDIHCERESASARVDTELAFLDGHLDEYADGGCAMAGRSSAGWAAIALGLVLLALARRLTSSSRVG